MGSYGGRGRACTKDKNSMETIGFNHVNTVTKLVSNVWLHICRYMYVYYSICSDQLLIILLLHVLLMVIFRGKNRTDKCWGENSDIKQPLRDFLYTGYINMLSFEYILSNGTICINVC